MPTCTLPFEILFEFINDTTKSSTLQLTREGEDGFSSNAIVTLQPQESISLVLNAGSAYHYLLKQDCRKAQLSCVPTICFPHTDNC
ncbi:hypothetical protein HYPSUDRAFT_128082 [Hypholoma sublateritium FD-334 SS-4]|uniref:Uncharacterized protein n=1 Tax=Hypholoma sublateritium (strain FD-334 SS-4) TaxID=945553 RepID=A0A0D2MYI5_HYPSF|nr:hypothetical protein HYPSUDRAFT_128082 [Hypholoma sublateritium FD-334 SS-4]